MLQAFKISIHFSFWCFFTRHSPPPLQVHDVLRALKEKLSKDGRETVEAIVEWYCRRTPGNPDGSSFKWIQKKSEMDLGPRMDLRWTFWTFGFVELQHLYGHCPAVRLQVVQLLRCGAMGAPRCSHLFVMFSCGLCHGKSWNGKKETRISKAMKWWMTWALNFERNFDLRTSHICFGVPLHSAWRFGSIHSF